MRDGKTDEALGFKGEAGVIKERMMGRDDG